MKVAHASSSTFERISSNATAYSSKPLVTIGVCVRNCEIIIRGAIRSIMQQDFPHALMEVIFVDDGSEDATVSVIHDLVSNMDFDVKIFSYEWRGLGFARQVVVENARGKYIIWVDGDMMLSSDHVRKQVEFMEKNPSVGIAKGRYVLSRDEGLVAFLEDVPFIVFYYQHEGKTIEKLPGTGGAIYRVEAIKRVGGFDSRIKGAAEDIDLEYRIRNAGWRVYVSPATFYEKRPRTWKNLWVKYFWYGYGMHYVLNKNRNIERLYEMSPLAALVEGFWSSISAYKFVRSKRVFLLPLHFFFKMSAWSFGYAKSHFNSYGH